MAQFDIYEYSSPNTSYLIDLQDNVVDDLTTRVVAPLISIEDIPLQMEILNPVIRFDGVDFLLMTHLLAAIPIFALKKKVSSAAGQRDEIIASLDLLFTGF
jgi:toxin CcdB